MFSLEKQLHFARRIMTSSRQHQYRKWSMLRRRRMTTARHLLRASASVSAVGICAFTRLNLTLQRRMTSQQPIVVRLRRRWSSNSRTATERVWLLGLTFPIPRPVCTSIYHADSNALLYRSFPMPIAASGSGFVEQQQLSCYAQKTTAQIFLYR